jgi:hypothetical protein
MGLISEYRKYKKQKEMVAFLEEEYGITKDDLKYIHEALEKVKELKTRTPLVLDEKTKEEIELVKKTKMTPEQFVEVFAKETEEFYPYGKPKE